MKFATGIALTGFAAFSTALPQSRKSTSFKSTQPMVDLGHEYHQAKLQDVGQSPSSVELVLTVADLQRRYSLYLLQHPLRRSSNRTPSIRCASCSLQFLEQYKGRERWIPRRHLPSSQSCLVGHHSSLPPNLLAWWKHLFLCDLIPLDGGIQCWL